MALSPASDRPILKPIIFPTLWRSLFILLRTGPLLTYGIFFVDSRISPFPWLCIGTHFILLRDSTFYLINHWPRIIRSYTIALLHATPAGSPISSHAHCRFFFTLPLFYPPISALLRIVASSLLAILRAYTRSTPAHFSMHPPRLRRPLPSVVGRSDRPFQSPFSLPLKGPGTSTHNCLENQIYWKPSYLVSLPESRLENMVNKINGYGRQ